jgi:hypothetical protein
MIDPEMPSKAEHDHLLYDDENGKRIGLQKVQSKRPQLAERTPRIRLMLRHPDLYIVYEAARVLTAWGDEAGLDTLEHLVDIEIHTLGEFAPHRIYGYDNVYDMLAEAVSYVRLRRADKDAQCARIYEKLLALYGPCCFEGRLKWALLECTFTQLAGPIDYAVTRALDAGRNFLASDLLPPLARFNPQRAWERFPTFANLPPDSPDPKINLAEALAFIPAEYSRPWLEQLAAHPDKVVSERARRSLAKLDGPPGGT